jgi:hypothetical protein
MMILASLLFGCGALAAQTTQQAGGDLGQTDAAVKTLATQLGEKLAAQSVQNVAVGQFAYMGGVTQFNSYMNNQLAGELADLSGRSFTLVAGGAAAQWIISGEIVRIADFIRIYTRVVRRSDSAVVAQTHIDVELNQSIASMFASDGGPMVISDEWEPDDRDTPVTRPVDGTPLSRTIHEGDEDWFAITTDSVAELVMQTTGEMDVYMELYDAETAEQISTDDDGGDGNNSRIAHFVQPGQSYLVKVRGYSEDTVGEYSFSATTQTLDDATPYAVPSGDEAARFVMRTLDGGSGDMFLLAPATNGTMIMETTGDTDVFMELYDADDYQMLDSDDDSAGSGNSRITRPVGAGERYVARVRGYSSGSTGSYGFRAYMGEE